MTRRRATFLTLFALLLPALAGCGGDSNICTVKGTLTYKGQPMPSVYLRMEPDDLKTKSTSMAVTDANGKFEMMIGSTPGVFRGKVKVFCDDPLAAMGSSSPVPKEIEKAFRELCTKYGTGKAGYDFTIDKSHSDLKLDLN
jgi:hypothetical protein